MEQLTWHEEADRLPISALQHLIYCPRQTALIHLERAWEENQFTAEGRVLHKKTHNESEEYRPGVTITRSMPVTSGYLGVTGQCDVVEFHRDGNIIPVEYKRGKPKLHQADEVQLCAQAICLEDMLSISISKGFLFYGKRKRRTGVVFDSYLREFTKKRVEELHDLIASRITPAADYDPGKCDACSLIDFCQPQAFRLRRGVAAWFKNQLTINTA